MTNTSRDLGAVAGVAALGFVVNGQLTVNLLRQLSAIGIPKQFRSEVVTAVTTGSFSNQAAKAAEGSAAIATIVHKVVSAAYGAFAHGLDLSLMIAAVVDDRVGPGGGVHHARSAADSATHRADSQASTACSEACMSR